jgi:hypothetical protein
VPELKAHCATHPRRDKPDGEEHGDVAWRSGDVAVMSALGISSKPGVLIVPSCALGAWDRPGRLSAEAAWLISSTSPGGKGWFCSRRAILSRSSAFPTASSPFFSRSWPTSTDFFTGCGFRSDSQPTGRSRATRATSRRLPSAPASPSQCPRQVEFTRQPRHGLAFVGGGSIAMAILLYVAYDTARAGDLYRQDSVQANPRLIY